MTLSRSLILVLLINLLSGCGSSKTTPKPPFIGQAQEITRMQTAGLEKMTTISAQVRGSPMDVEAEIQRKANASGARYYLIIMNSDTIVAGQWYSQAILYR
ncbi:MULTISPECIES: biofilm peroxide resistance protein BsmA [unclassified Serratia (in: enterobacteria)]|uniref:biofilm peroxide resistance protein BsmA n=1 Tax=unclassified Serratia (in: enterobacteria) TaxID=2647522 RepID=UPI0005074C95|nr:MULTISPECIES: biofilm peroxide resistance protein BsmA [unclassified Serratia (in: enterobacteria)]KFK91853.1 biofilm stress and motility protein A [Serratia sp. Ag2]KFK95485.1 biofilm stress and motility protein A [Serratia sp. Ag1]